MARENKPQYKLDDWRSNPAQMVNEEFGAEPDAWQHDVLKAFPSQDPDKIRISMQACAGPGKLIRSVTPIPTPTGYKQHGDLETGDRVFAEDGSICKVVATITWDNIQMYRVTFSDGSSVECGAQHMWKVQSRHFEKFKSWNVIETQELVDLEPVKVYPGMSPRGTDRRVRRFRIPRQGAVNYPEVDLPIDPYLLGLWLGDGCRNSGVITMNDTESLEEIVSRGYAVKKRKKHDGSGQHWNVEGLRKSLRLLGISHLYSGQKFIPEIYKRSSIEARKDILRGLMDTDGRIKINGMMDFHSTSRELIEDFVEVARSLGQYAHYERETDTHRKSDCYAASLRTDFNPFRIKRKADRWEHPPEHQMYRYIESIEKLDVDSGKCIEIDHPSHCYLASDFIATHNSAVLAWCAWNFMSCYGFKNHHPKGAAISMTRENLKDNLWAEIAGWRGRSEYLKHYFEWNQERIFAKDHPEDWFITARSYKKAANVEEQGRTLSGLHAPYVLYLIDESGDIPPAVLRSAEQGLAGPIWSKIMQAGNPTSHEGMLYLAATAQRDKWHIIKITSDPEDPKRTPRVPVEYALDMIKQYGRDNPWVMSYILGSFPPSSINTLLSPEDVEIAMARKYAQESYMYSQKRIGVDVAYEGDDSTVIFPRQGCQAFNPVQMRNQRNPEIAARTIQAKIKWEAEKVFIDNTGGFGAGVIDFMRQAQEAPIGVHFSSKAIDKRYYNKRSEMWFLMSEKIKEDLALPNNTTLAKELVAPTYTMKNGALLLEPKELVKKRLGFSPDFGDSLALTFALPEAPAQKVMGIPLHNRQAVEDWDPYNN